MVNNAMHRPTGNDERRSFKHKGYSFAKTNRLLDRKGMPYRKKDVRSKRGRFNSKRVEETPPEPTVQAPEEPDTKESYANLLSSMRKRPKVYFEQIINQLAKDKKDEEDDEEDDNEDDIEDDNEGGKEGQEEESEEEESDEDEDEDKILSDEEIELKKTSTFQSNYASTYTEIVKTKPAALDTVSHPLYNVKVSSSEQTHSIVFTEVKTVGDMVGLDIEPALADQWQHTTKQVQTKGLMRPVSNMLLSAISTGRDVLFSDSNFENQQETIKVLSLHILNHVMKTRKAVLKNNNVLLKASQSGRDIDTETCRDQGFTRPKVLVLLPFRNVAHKFAKQLIKLALPGEKRQVSNKKRLDEEYGVDADDKPSLNKSLSYQKMFTGNNDDCFTLGIALAKNSVKLYTDFYKSDIILASPLGLRTVIGGEGDKERDFDFLSSIEINCSVMSDVFLMQNWEHLLHIYKHLHLTPGTDHGTDFSRVKMWYLDGLAAHYRQNIILSSLNSPEINSLLSKQCGNWRGCVKVSKSSHTGVLGAVVFPVRQVFKKMPERAPTQDQLEYLTTGRFQYFLTSVLPQYQTADVNQIVIVVPSYFDFVRLRNNFKKEGLHFSQLSEYTSNRSITQTRKLFAEGQVKYLLTTERYFFFKRYKLKDVQHVIFYEPPLYQECYTHYINMITAEEGTSTLIYNKFDGTRLERLLGSAQCSAMMSSQLTTHMIISE